MCKSETCIEETASRLQAHLLGWARHGLLKEQGEVIEDDEPAGGSYKDDNAVAEDYNGSPSLCQAARGGLSQW